MAELFKILTFTIYKVGMETMTALFSATYSEEYTSIAKKEKKLC